MICARAVLLLAAVAVVAAGCSSGGADELSADQAVTTDTVVMPPSYRFEPPVISVEQGTTVTWKNEDNFTHDVTIDVGGAEQSHTVEKGEQIKIAFNEKGTFDYVCRFHENDMRGKVIVT